MPTSSPRSTAASHSATTPTATTRPKHELAARRDRRTGDRYVRKPTEFPGTTTASGETAYGEAGPPPRGPSRGTVLDFGRYRGWTLGQVALHDPDFLLWLERSPAGRQYRLEIAQLLGKDRR